MKKTAIFLIITLLLISSITLIAKTKDKTLEKEMFKMQTFLAPLMYLKDWSSTGASKYFGRDSEEGTMMDAEQSTKKDADIPSLWEHIALIFIWDASTC